MAQPPQNWGGVFLKANSVVSIMPQRPRGELDQLRHFPTGSSEIPQEFLTEDLLFGGHNRGHEPRFVFRSSMKG
jgi:hypothetical protein